MPRVRKVVRDLPACNVCDCIDARKLFVLKLQVPVSGPESYS